MGDKRQNQIEILQSLAEYTQRLNKAMETVATELCGQKEDDTDEFLKQIIEGINWSIQALNGTLDIVNEDEIRIDKEEVNDKIVAFSKAYQSNNDKVIGLAIINMLPIFQKIHDIAAEY